MDADASCRGYIVCLCFVNLRFCLALIDLFALFSQFMALRILAEEFFTMNFTPLLHCLQIFLQRLFKYKFFKV